jgi:hypothetical protein
MAARSLFLALVVLTAAACTPQERPAESGAALACRGEANATAVFAGGDATVRTAVDGPNCTEATATLTLTGADGATLAAFEAPYWTLHHVGEEPPMDFAPTQAEVDAFLASWAAPSLPPAANLPDWPEGASGPGQDGPPMRTTLSRDAYLAIRGGGGVQFCYLTGVTTSRCIAMNSAGQPVETLVIG